MRTSTRPSSSFQSVTALLVAFALGAVLLAMPALAQTPVFINELHYDNVGGDVGEFVEIAGPAGTDLSNYQIQLYNGANGNTYDTFGLSGTIPDQDDGFGTVAFSRAGIQNGAPDGLALVDLTETFSGGSTVVQFLSYEGSFTANNGPAAGMMSEDIGVQEGSGTAIGASLQLTGTGTTYEDFTWSGPGDDSPGAVNAMQDFGMLMPGPVVVNTLDDEIGSGADCALREAVTATNTDASFGGCTYTGVDEIVFSVAGAITLVFGSDLDVTDSVSIDSDGAITVSGGAGSRPDGSAQDFGGASRIFDVVAGTLTLEEITLVDGLADEGGLVAVRDGATLIADQVNFLRGTAFGSGGGAIFSFFGTVTLRNGRIADSHATNGSSRGGGVLSDESDLTVENMLIEDNSAIGGGGGIANVGFDATATVTGASTIRSNSTGTSSGNGGGIFNSGAITVTGASTIELNEAGGEGGGVWSDIDGALTVDGGSSVSSNTARSDGGGIFNRSGTFTIDDATIISNGAGDGSGFGSGGGIFSVGPFTIADATVAGNRASTAGAGIKINHGTLDITNTDITGNGDPVPSQPPTNGGGLHITGGTVDITGGSVENNTAREEGGGIWNEGGTLTINGTTISGNSAEGNGADQGGGGLFSENGEGITITDATISGNFAPGTSGSGGGIFNDGGTLTINGGTLSGNGAHRAGGGIEIASGDLTLNDVVITDNFIPPAFANPGNGGGIHIGGGTADINGGTITGNSAAEGGGLWSSAPTTIDPLPDGPPVDISGNTAFGDAPDQGGGGIFFTGPTAPVLNDVIIIDNQATGTEGSGGGLFIEGPTQVTINTSTISGNMANRAGGGIEILTPVSAPDLAILHLVRSTVDGNSFDTPNPGNGGGLHITGHALAQVEQSTFSNNTAEEGGGLWNSSSGFIGLLNSTVSGNIATGDGGGVIAFTGLERPAHGDAAREAVTDDLAESTSGLFLGFVELSSTTVTNNTAGQAGGGLHEGGAGVPVQGDDSVFILQNSLIGDNSAPSGPDCFGLFQSGDHNLIEDVAGCVVIGDVDNNVTMQDPVLGALADNGGPTQTHALLEGSPAISAGSSNFDVDQRGVLRDNEDDIGAFESDLAVAVGPCPETLIISDFAAFADGNAFELRNTGAVPAPLAGCSFVATYNDVYVALDLGDGTVLPGAAVDFMPGDQFRNVFGGLALLDREEVPTIGTTIGAIADDLIASLVYLGHDVVYGFYHRNTASFAAQCMAYDMDRRHSFAESQCLPRSRSEGVESGAGPVALGHAELTAAMLTAERGATAAEGETLPTAFALSAAYPNPLSQRGTLTVDVPEAADVRVVVYDVLGRAVAVLLDEAVEAGRYAVSLDASSLAPGTYLVRLAAGGFAQTRRMTVVR